MGYFALSLLCASMIGRLWLDSKRWTQQPIVKSAVQSQSRKEGHKKKSEQPTLGGQTKANHSVNQHK